MVEACEGGYLLSMVATLYGHILYSEKVATTFSEYNAIWHSKYKAKLGIRYLENEAS